MLRDGEEHVQCGLEANADAELETSQETIQAAVYREGIWQQNSPVLHRRWPRRRPHR
jgi:hypothetical protein